MGKKRPSEDSEVSEPQAKKVTLTEFNGTIFKSMLKDPTKAMKGECGCSASCHSKSVHASIAACRKRKQI